MYLGSGGQSFCGLAMNTRIRLQALSFLPQAESGLADFNVAQESRSELHLGNRNAKWARGIREWPLSGWK